MEFTLCRPMFYLKVGNLCIVCNDECFVCAFVFLGLGILNVNDMSNSSESKSFSDSDREPPVRLTCIGSSRIYTNIIYFTKFMLLLNYTRNRINIPNSMVQICNRRILHQMMMLILVRHVHVQVLYKLFELNR